MNNNESDRGTLRDRRSSGLNLGSSEYEEGLFNYLIFTLGE